MTDQRDSVTAGEYLTGLEKVLTEENAALRRERDEAHDDIKALCDERRELRAAIAKKDEALRKIAELAYAGAKNAETLQRIEKIALATLAAAPTTGEPT